ncbi:MAG: sigma-70 family RNA polymerase sigma factor [Dehalococcoidia bacterium]|nr:sigma-70 family RNA polymerase sigma factor [Dehalococcoidia bacterium]
MSIEENIVSRAVKGDGEAFALLYEEYLDKIYRYIYLRLGNKEGAEDLTQEVFARALEAIGHYKWRNLPFASWLFRIAHNQVIDHFRKESKIEKIDWDDNIAPSHDPGPESITQHKLEAKELAETVKKLSPAQREVISLRFGAELSVAEAAEVLGKNPGTIKALQHNAIISLRKMMAGTD